MDRSLYSFRAMPAIGSASSSSEQTSMGVSSESSWCMDETQGVDQDASMGAGVRPNLAAAGPAVFVVNEHEDPEVQM